MSKTKTNKTPVKIHAIQKKSNPKGAASDLKKEKLNLKVDESKSEKGSYVLKINGKSPAETNTNEKNFSDPVTLEIHQIDPLSGGDCALILFKDKSDKSKPPFSILVDTSNTVKGENVSQILKYIEHHLGDGIPNIIIISHFDQDHWGGAERFN